MMLFCLHLLGEPLFRLIIINGRLFCVFFFFVLPQQACPNRRQGRLKRCFIYQSNLFT